VRDGLMCEGGEGGGIVLTSISMAASKLPPHKASIVSGRLIAQIGSNVFLITSDSKTRLLCVCESPHSVQIL
jgi:hypothetical protein